MSDWIPTNLGDVGPLYLQIVVRLEQDIAKGVLARGARLLPHRDMADRLKLSVGTVARAYDEAERRGLISGEVGRGTFVLGEVSRAVGRNKSMNLALNAPPLTAEDVGNLLCYLPHQGIERHRTIIAGWLDRHGMLASADGLFITHGAQHAISIAMGLLAGPGDSVLAENLTYSGMR